MMGQHLLADELRARLKTISTASAATALFKRGFRNQFVQEVVPVSPKREVMVGQAFTLRYIPAREDRNPVEVFRDPNHPQRVAIETCPPGCVLVMDARMDARAATAGSILITRLALRGAAGVVSDGGFRDARGIGALDMPAYYARPSAPTNLVLHEALEINVPISCGGAPVFPGDIMLGDHDGVLVIPWHVVEEIVVECVDMEIYEDFVLEEVHKGAPIIGLYPCTDAALQRKYAEWRSAHDQQHLTGRRSRV
jgi:regulator of RNase E activity RraA